MPRLSVAGVLNYDESDPRAILVARNYHTRTAYHRPVCPGYDALLSSVRLPHELKGAARRSGSGTSSSVFRQKAPPPATPTQHTARAAGARRCCRDSTPAMVRAGRERIRCSYAALLHFKGQAAHALSKHSPPSAFDYLDPGRRGHLIQLACLDLPRAPSPMLPHARARSDPTYSRARAQAQTTCSGWSPALRSCANCCSTAV